MLGFPWWGVERQQADALGSVLRTRACFHFVFDVALATDPRLIASPPGWNELLIASFSHRSINSKDGVLLASELQRDSANSAGVGAIFDRYGRRAESVDPGALLHAAERRLKRTPVWFVTGRTCRVQRSGPSLTGNLLFFPSACLRYGQSDLLNPLHLSPLRVLTELVNKMRDMQMDKTELGCLRAIVLFNPGARARPASGASRPEIGANPHECFADAKGLSKSSEVELLREKVYASLEAYCKQRYPEQQGR